jgi:predicted HTH domain antitoxin
MSHRDPDVAAMKVSDIRAELKKLNIDFSDCFDKESLVTRLEDARKGKVKASKKEEVEKPTPVEHPTSANKPSEPGIDMLGEVRSMSVRELREELASRGIRWADFFEKNDLIQAVLEARRNAASFSATGLILPGKVADLSGEDLQREIESKTLASPLLVDVCKLFV